ncbi:hypothetical protein FDP22_07450 [Paroceanicella profunda]|uniref:Uncharacterized protein n=1 Tax=Paroceanicella profunda TaxID=2579971 RepID=A0A5B8FTF7_9RHOB|nr:hypothetical protein [Paroceanicella profunda]QDL91635.1 hypothetical protein FDP22_07450 [Paroceanicella profunda]
MLVVKKGSGIDLIAAERERQVSAEGWTPEHNDDHDAGEIAGAASAYTLSAACLLNPYHGTPLNEPPEGWQWDASWWKPNMGDNPARDLAKSGALSAAEIDRMDRLERPW